MAIWHGCMRCHLWVPIEYCMTNIGSSPRNWTSGRLCFYVFSHVQIGYKVDTTIAMFNVILVFKWGTNWTPRLLPIFMFCSSVQIWHKSDCARIALFDVLFQSSNWVQIECQDYYILCFLQCSNWVQIGYQDCCVCAILVLPFGCQQDVYI